MSGFYHQDERDEAANVGVVTLIVAFAIAVCLCVVACHGATLTPWTALRSVPMR